jgi:MoaA/NifB/PqqE/SkfB family radical SAM enzyme
MIKSLETTRPLFKSDHLRPTQRGWLFMGRHGGPCDKACKMCYYAYQNQLTFYKLDTLIAHANLFRHHYGLGYCDISGGEATIYGPKSKDGRRPDLETLLRHCRRIGLLPTIITHGQNNTEALVKGIEEAGLEDWLISMHGLAGGHDQTVVNHSGKGDGGWHRLVAGLKHITRPVRFNTTVQDFNVQELPALAQWLVDNRPATVWNMIQFNPFYAWAGKEVIEFQGKMSEIAPSIGEAVRIAEAAGWEVNVRYFPFCVAAEHGFARNCVNFYQTQYDPWEWCLATTNRVPMEAINQIGGIEATRRVIADNIAQSRNNPECTKCRFHPICEGPTDQYQARYGNSELKPIEGEPITDIAYFEKGGRFASGD